ncbi:unnamed protein product [Rotaria magnacalcarata]|uniref:Uncharacterized protein n=1 Tax=Rotaria magnacalcarata TaxID=392030 RepID=A0A816UI61_9BILA|nr:unnamed protein product [Rotaria magnacalcarata]CAF4103726.1 unnamed protein product [Rotaria magnacalcarata]
MTTWFFFSENQQEKINKTFISGLKIVYGLHGWDDITTLILSQEKTLREYIYAFWLRFSIHLEKSQEATSYQHTWTAFQTITTIDKTFYKKLGFRKNNEFLNRLTERAKHGRYDWLQFQQSQTAT